jgi:hypothetical protein
MLKKIKIEHLFIVCMFVLFAGLLVSYQKDFEAQRKMQGAPMNIHGDFVLCIGLHSHQYIKDFYIQSTSDNPYPPLANLALWLFAKNNIDSFFLFQGSEHSLSMNGFIFISTFIMFFSCMILFQLSNLKTGPPHIKFLSAIALIFSGIYLHAFYAANLVILSYAFMTFFIVNYKNERKIIRETAILALALAVTLKPYTAFIGILLLFDKKCGLLMRAALYSILLVFVPFFFLDLPPDIPATGVIDKFFINVLGWLDVMFDSSIHLSFPTNIGGNVFAPEIRAILKPLIYAASIVLTIPAIVCAPFLKAEDEWKKILLMICSFLLIAGGGTVSQYTLIYLFPCVIMFLNSNTKINLSNMVYLIGFILILNPLQIGKVSGITISWFFVKIGFWIVFFHMVFDGFRELLKEKDWRNRIWFLNLKGN